MDFHAFRIPAPGRMILTKIKDSSPLPDDHVEGVMLASAVSPGTEIASAFTLQDPAKPASSTGYAAVFRVVNAGPTSGCSIGDIRFAMATHASWVRCLGSSTIQVPAGVDPVHAALARLAGVSWSSLCTTSARPPEWVAVTGLGIIGNFAAQIFAAAGYQVLACDPVSTRRKHLAKRGIAMHDRLPFNESAWEGRIALVVECAGHEGATHDACRMVRKGGEVVLVGVPWTRRADLQAFDLCHAIFHRYVHVRSGWEWEVPYDRSDFRQGSIRDHILAAMHWISDGRIRTDGIVHRADPRDCEAVYRDLQTQRGEALTAVFDWHLLEHTQ